MNVLKNTQSMLRETLQVELREFDAFCRDQGINATLASTIAMNQCLAAGGAVAEQSFGMDRDAFLEQAALVWDLYQDAQGQPRG